MALHLGWIPNEPGLRPRAYDQPRPAAPDPDPAVVARLAAAQHARALWARLLVAFGLLAVALFGPIALLAHVRWAGALGAGLALCCWLPVARLARNRRRAAARLQAHTREQQGEHAAALTRYEQGRARWARAEAHRVAAAPRWLQVAGPDAASRLDVFGGTGAGRRNLVTGLGRDLLAQRAVIVLDLSQDRVADGLLLAAARAGLSAQDYRLPADLAVTPLLAGLTGEQVASLIVEVVHADDATATAADRATDLMILRKVTGVLGAGPSLGRVHAALAALLGEHAAPLLTREEQARLAALFGDAFRSQVAGNLLRLAAVVEPLAALGADAGRQPREPARLTCLSLADGPRDVTTDLAAALVVQWVTRAVADGAGPGAAARPAVILAGADEQSTRHLARLTAVCERHGVPLVRAFSRLTEESARHLDTRHTAFLRLATRPEAVRAAEHIGLERRFVAGRFAQRHSVSRSRTRTTSESVTHTTGRTEGASATHTVGTTAGESTSEARVPRRDQQQKLSVQVEDRRPPAGRREPADHPPSPERRPGDASPASSARRPGQGGDGGSRKVSVTQDGRTGRPQVDVIRTRTRFSARHESDATTRSWSATEETSKTSATADSLTDGISVGDEVTYELTYDHQVQPETLMALPEDQMLVPHVTESHAGPAAAVTPGATVTGGPVSATGLPGPAERKLVALVIDPAVVGSDLVAPVRPGEIPAFEPPAPPISGPVPEYASVPRRGRLAPGP